MSLPQKMIADLADLCERRYHSALAEGIAERAVFEELVAVILETYMEAVGIDRFTIRTHDAPERPQ